jgi:glycosyltransferase involved in cell wall biosynthesis
VKLSLIVPIYRNEACIPDLLRAMEDLNRQLSGEFEAVLVVDGSPDRSLELLTQSLPDAAFESQLLALSTNFGSFAAIRAGLASATGDLFAVMAADLQEPPELILKFRDLLRQGQHDVVVGTRQGRDDPFGKRLASAIFWKLYRRFVQRQMPPGGIDVFACNRAFRDQLLDLHESNTTLVGLILWMGFRRAEIPYARRARRHGKSAWSFWRRFRYLLDSTFAFSDLPIRVLSFAGAMGMSLSVILMGVVLIAKLTHKIEVPGYTATVLTVMFFGGLNALGLGLIGEYVWRTFQNTKGRPSYIVAQRKQFQKKDVNA